jgi:hypothetical protein
MIDVVFSSQERHPGLFVVWHRTEQVGIITTVLERGLIKIKLFLEI